jgi:hypothetical protein
MPYSSEKMIELAILDDSVEVSILATLLEERGIRYLMEPMGSTPYGYGGIFETQKGQARLKVFQSDAEVAQELLDDFYQAPAMDEQEAPEKDSSE